MKIWRKRLTYLPNELISEEAVYRTAPATPGLLNIDRTKQNQVTFNKRRRMSDKKRCQIKQTQLH